MFEKLSTTPIQLHDVIRNLKLLIQEATSVATNPNWLVAIKIPIWLNPHPKY
jgi:hypothetical protein